MISREFEKSYPDLHTFAHEAMNTVFEIAVLHADVNYASQAAAEAFMLLDLLDADLSRFNPNGDVARINGLGLGQSLPVGMDTFHCLMVAREMNRVTQGAFDITAGWLKDDMLKAGTGRKECKPVGMRHVLLDEAQWTVSTDAPVQVDLGAIGKGYALDRMGELLREWELENCLVHGGQSSVWAMGAMPGRHGWPVTLRHPSNQDRLLARPDLFNQGMGGSGLGKGPHIINPLTRKSEGKVLAAWAIADTAAVSDALSTAFMVMEPGDVDALCTASSRIHAMAVYGENSIISRWGM
jgi:thiamine biosynthesis lipoprotein